jgi:hypothetical protein
MPEDSDKPANPKDADPKAKAPERKDRDADDRSERKWYTWPRRIWAVLGAVAVIGGVVAFGGEVDHWFSGLSSSSNCGMSGINQIARSPNLGISFHQASQVAPMSYENSTTNQVPLIKVCLSSAPFEIWFPALGPTSVVEICTYGSLADYRLNPFYHGRGTPGCLALGVGAASSRYGGSSLDETVPRDPVCVVIAGNRAEPASGGDDKYFVSTVVSLSGAVPMSQQTANLYLIVFATNKPLAQGPDADVEHFVLQFK